MNVRESLGEASENFDGSSITRGFIVLIACVTLGTQMAVLFAFQDRLTADQFDAIWSVSKVGFYALVGVPALNYLSEFFAAFEIWSPEGESEEQETDADEVQFGEMSEDSGGKVIDGEEQAREGSA
ncbi:hypothetical protein [Halorussus pelagicus]|uniref:hypothetical protein n=1 Tax=Halorussus pelagicus TaxID=2505977 RepID=UPI000FFB07DC|nr:hypothetical protein [Halorussus pelagicus]